MKIKRFEAHNVRGAQHISFEPAKVTFFTGPSGAGKSSAMDALRYSLTGALPKDGVAMGREARVSITLDGLGIIQRQKMDGKTAKVRVNGKATTGKSANEMLDEVFGCSASTAALMTSSEVVRKKDLIDYLFQGGFLKNDVTFKRLVALCDGLSDEAVEELATLLPGGGATITLEDIAKAHETAVAVRMATKKLLEEANARAKYDGSVPDKSAAVIQSEIRAIDVKLSEIQAKRTAYKQSKAASEKREQTLRALTTELQKYAAVTAVGSRELSMVRENLTNAQKLVNSNEVAIRESQNTVRSMEKVLHALETPICPISGRLVCTTDKTVVRDELETVKRDAEDTLTELLKQRKDYAEALRRAETRQTELMERDRQYQRKIALRRQYDDTEALTIAVPELPDESEVAALQAKQTTLHASLNMAITYERACQEQARANALSEKVKIYEELVSNLAANGGIRKQVLLHSIGVLEDACNKKMATVLPKYAMGFDPDDNFEVMLTCAEGNIHYEALSSGEKTRMAYVLLSTLNELNGFRVLLLDDVNTLDLNSFKLLLALIKENEADFDHVFISGIDHPGFEDAVKSCGLDCSIHHFG